MSTMLNTSTHILDSETETISHMVRIETDSVHITEFHPTDGSAPHLSADCFPGPDASVRVYDIGGDGNHRIAVGVGGNTLYITIKQAADLATKLAEVVETKTMEVL